MRDPRYRGLYIALILVIRNGLRYFSTSKINDYPRSIMPSTYQLEGTFFAQFEQNNDDSVGDAQLISPPTNPGIFFAVLVDVLPDLSPL